MVFGPPLPNFYYDEGYVGKDITLYNRYLERYSLDQKNIKFSVRVLNPSLEPYLHVARVKSQTDLQR